jgi:hypothetical protein
VLTLADFVKFPEGVRETLQPPSDSEGRHECVFRLPLCDEVNVRWFVNPGFLLLIEEAIIADDLEALRDALSESVPSLPRRWLTPLHLRTILSRLLDGGAGTRCTRSRAKTDRILIDRALGKDKELYKTAFGRWAGVMLLAHEAALENPKDKTPEKHLGAFAEVPNE